MSVDVNLGCWGEQGEVAVTLLHSSRDSTALRPEGAWHDGDLRTLFLQGSMWRGAGVLL